MRLSVGIKALNEEAHIAAAIESALEAVSDLHGEVIVADCGSTDRTVEIAARRPITVVRLRNALEKSCGTGAQLAFQFSSGTYFYLMDGDMVLERPFIESAIRYLDAHPDVAAVGGSVVDKIIANMEFEIRLNGMKTEEHRRSGTVDRLDGGGLYRRAAISQIGYFSDRNLHGYEEFDLGARLVASGWRLVRIPDAAVAHYGHTSSSYGLLLRRFTSGYAYAGGELLRAAYEGNRLLFVLKRFEKLRQWFTVALWWMSLIGAILLLSHGSRAIALIVLLLTPLAFLTIKRRSIRLGVYSFASWQVFTVGCLLGLMRKRRPPSEPLSCDIIRTPIRCRNGDCQA